MVVANLGIPSSVSILSGNGDGTLGLPGAIPVDADPEGLALTDIDLDGHLDIVTTSGITDHVDLLVSNGNVTGTGVTGIYAVNNILGTDLTVIGRLGEFGQAVIKRKADQLMQDFAECLARQVTMR